MKKYAAVWGPGYFPTAEVIDETHEFLQSPTDFGYSEEDMNVIKALEPGETWRAPTPEFHTITRIE